MDHSYINEFDFVERYLMGRLAAEETTQFEEHFVDCVPCIEQLKLTKALMEGLRVVASDRTLESGKAVPKSPRSYPRKSIALAAAGLALLALVGGVFVTNQIRGARAEADQARIATTQWEHRYEEERQSSAAAEKQHQESESELTEQVAQLRKELEAGKKQGAVTGAQVNIPILALIATRGSEPPAGPVNDVVLSGSSPTFVIVLRLEEEGGYRGYAMTILDSQKKLVWTGHGFKPDRFHSLSLSLNSTLFHPGNYLLRLDGVARDGSISIVGQYPFRVRK